MTTDPEPDLSEINSDNICVGKRIVWPGLSTERIKNTNDRKFTIVISL